MLVKSEGKLLGIKKTRKGNFYFVGFGSPQDDFEVERFYSDKVISHVEVFPVDVCLTINIRGQYKILSDISLKGVK